MGWALQDCARSTEYCVISTAELQGSEVARLAMTALGCCTANSSSLKFSTKWRSSSRHKELTEQVVLKGTETARPTGKLVKLRKETTQIAKEVPETDQSYYALPLPIPTQYISSKEH